MNNQLCARHKLDKRFQDIFEQWFIGEKGFCDPVDFESAIIDAALRVKVRMKLLITVLSIRNSYAAHFDHPMTGRCIKSCRLSI